MSEITLSEAERNYNAARLHLELLTHQEGIDPSELSLADINAIQAKLTFVGLGGKIQVGESEEDTRLHEINETAAKLNTQRNV